MRVEGLSTAEFGQKFAPGTDSAKGREAYVLRRRAAERRSDTLTEDGGTTYVKHKTSGGAGKEPVVEEKNDQNLSEIKEEEPANS